MFILLFIWGLIHIILSVRFDESLVFRSYGLYTALSQTYLIDMPVCFFVLLLWPAVSSCTILLSKIFKACILFFRLNLKQGVSLSELFWTICIRDWSTCIRFILPPWHFLRSWMYQNGYMCTFAFTLSLWFCWCFYFQRQKICKKNGNIIFVTYWFYKNILMIFCNF